MLGHFSVSKRQLDVSKMQSMCFHCRFILFLKHAHIWSKTPPRRPKGASKTPQDASKTPPRRPKTPHNAPKCAPRRPQDAPRRPKDDPSVPNTAPTLPQHCPKTPPRRPKRPLDALIRHLDELNTILGRFLRRFLAILRHVMTSSKVTPLFALCLLYLHICMRARFVC
jgi:hypothetical protein